MTIFRLELRNKKDEWEIVNHSEDKDYIYEHMRSVSGTGNYRVVPYVVPGTLDKEERQHGRRSTD